MRKYQYDVKNAAHLIRLLRMGIEFLETGHLQVFRTTDADELKRIKRGGWRSICESWTSMIDEMGFLIVR